MFQREREQFRNYLKGSQKKRFSIPGFIGAWWSSSLLVGRSCGVRTWYVGPPSPSSSADAYALRLVPCVSWCGVGDTTGAVCASQVGDPSRLPPSPITAHLYPHMRYFPPSRVLKVTGVYIRGCGQVAGVRGGRSGVVAALGAQHRPPLPLPDPRLVRRSSLLLCCACRGPHVLHACAALHM